MILELGMAVGGGLLNAFAGAEENRQREKEKQQALSILRENLIDANELDATLRDINRMFNSRLISTLNSTALRSRGTANQAVVKGVTAGQVEGQRLGTLAESRFRADESNRQTYGQMAQVEASMGSKGSFIGDFFSGAMGAVPIGMELSKMLGSTGEKPFVFDEASNLIDAGELDDSGMYDTLGNNYPAWNHNVLRQFRPTPRGY